MLVNNGESITFHINTYDPDTGDSKDVDAGVPTVSVYDSAGAPVTGGIGTPVKIATGAYTVVLDTGSMVGLSVGKEYIVRAEATVTGSGAGATPITASTTIGMFQLSGVNHGKDLVNSLDGKTPRQVLAILAAVLSGDITTAGDAVEVFKDTGAGTTDRVSVTVDSAGNRSLVTFDLTDLN